MFFARVSVPPKKSRFSFIFGRKKFSSCRLQIIRTKLTSEISFLGGLISGSSLPFEARNQRQKVHSEQTCSADLQVRLANTNFYHNTILCRRVYRFSNVIFSFPPNEVKKLFASQLENVNWSEFSWKLSRPIRFVYEQRKT